jgi:protein gp37
MFPWVNGTWNPVKGCEHECKYCWARALAKQKLKNTKRYSDGFKPRLFEGDLKRKFGKGSSIFVSDMGDLFGEWVPRESITKVLDCIRRSPEAEFLLLTKNPIRYLEFTDERARMEDCKHIIDGLNEYLHR